jgi:hypothetical protein
MAAMISGIGPLTLREIDTPALLLDLDTLPQWHLPLNDGRVRRHYRNIREWFESIWTRSALSLLSIPFACCHS